MKKRIVISLFLIFLLFSVGSLITLYNLLSTTNNLRYLINLHEIEDIRQELSFNIQTVQNYTYASPDEFARNLDAIFNAAAQVDDYIVQCHDCHHQPEVKAELERTEELIREYQEKLSYLITTVSEGPRRRESRRLVSQLSSTILTKVQGMVARAAATLNIRTAKAMREIDHSYVFMTITLGSTFLMAFFIARYLTRRIARPIDELLTATGKITAGDLGYRANYQGNDEFGKLCDTFNDMSLSLAANRARINLNMQRLTQLSNVTLPLHSAPSNTIILNYLRTCITSLVDVEQTGIMLPDEKSATFNLHLSAIDGQPARPIELDKKKVLTAYNDQKGQPFVQNEFSEKWPFGDKPEAMLTGNLLILWMVQHNELTGGMLAINKKEGGFTEEDQKILGILTNNIGVAFENRRLYGNIEHQVQELKNTQRQLVEAEKLTAIGTLAGGVAHDFNNILCGMIGHVALLKRKQTPETNDYKMLDTIEKAGFRAANLTKQLLAFSRQGVVETRTVHLNDSITNVVELFRNTISKMITIQLELATPSPVVDGDPAQLEQVVMNLCVNARDAMPDGGQIVIETAEVKLDEKFCRTLPDAEPGRYAKMTVSDSGSGIDEKLISRIFEPFFTTKEFGKGTGLGLSMVYGIVKSHEGFCHVTSVPDRGTRFSVYLPLSSGLPEELVIEKRREQPFHKYTILVAEDEELVATMLIELLRDLGCTTYLATNGVEAVNLLSDNRQEIDLVILDINMPVMGGKEAYGKLKEIKPTLKVLVASGYALSGTAKELLDMGADGFIQKPYSLNDISDKIRQVVG